MKIQSSSLYCLDSLNCWLSQLETPILSKMHTGWWELYVSTFSWVRYMWINEGSLPFSWQANGKSLSISIPANVQHEQALFSWVLEILHLNSPFVCIHWVKLVQLGCSSTSSKLKIKKTICKYFSHSESIKFWGNFKIFRV